MEFPNGMEFNLLFVPGKSWKVGDVSFGSILNDTPPPALW